MASREDLAAIVAALSERLEASERDIARERAARVAADEARVAERAARVAAEKAREASEKARFLEWMRSISSSSSNDTSSNADEGRRGAPSPTAASLSDVVGPSGAAGGASTKATCKRRWADFLARHATAWRQPLPGCKLGEVLDVQPVIAAALASLVPPGLRLWHDTVAEDDESSAKIRPDFCVSHARDAAASTLGAVLVVEVKLPGNLDAAERQTRIYLRRRVYKLCRERDARGESMDGVFALGAATDGRAVCIVRVSSGAPRAGCSFENAVPCPTQMCGPFELLGDWDFRSAPAPFAALEEPPEGFEALERLVRAAAMLATNEVLEAVIVTWEAPGEADAVSERLRLTGRLGSGGSSDAYSVEGGIFGAGAGSSRRALVLKTPRFLTGHVSCSYAAESDALSELTEAASRGLVPALVARGRREAGWPVLLLEPCGQPLAAWVSDCAAAAATADAGRVTRSSTAASSAAAKARLACAREVALRLFDALDAAHLANIIHCDVRPSNVAFALGKALLIDWGSSSKMGTDVHRRGVAAYADERIFSQSSYSARRAQDAAGALFTFLAVAFGRECYAPWLTAEVQSEDDIFRARSVWLQRRAESDGRIAHVRDALGIILGDSRARCGVGDADAIARARSAVSSF